MQLQCMLQVKPYTKVRSLPIPLPFMKGCLGDKEVIIFKLVHLLNPEVDPSPLLKVSRNIPISWFILHVSINHVRCQCRGNFRHYG